jgi:replicative DNA helicase
MANPANTNDQMPQGARELPNSRDLERAVLAVLLDGRHAVAMQIARSTVQHPMAFFQRDHRMVYLACMELDDAGHRIDAQSLIELLGRYPFQIMIDRLRQQQILFDNDQIDQLDRRRLRELYRRSADENAQQFADSALAALGGPNAIFEMMQAFGPAAGLKRNVELLWDCYLKRRLIVRMQSLCDKAYRTTDEFPRLLDDGNQAFLDLNKLNRIATVHAVADVVDLTLKRIVDQNENPEQSVKTGLPEIDDKIMSLRPGGLYVLAARPGVGKTSMALKMVSNIAGDVIADQGVLFFSLEVDRVDLMKKLLASESKVDFKNLDTGMVKPEEYAAVEEAAKRCKEWKLHLMDVSDLTVHGLRSVVKRHMLESQGKLRLVVLDYLQLLGSAKPDSNEYEKVSEISRVLKLIAMDMKIPVLALSQMSRESEKGASSAPREPRLSDLRGSGSIEQDADAVIFMHRADSGEGSKEDEVRHIKLIVAKNRFGPTGASDMNFNPSKMLFSPRHPESSDEQDHEGLAERSHHHKNQRSRSQAKPSADEDQFKADPDERREAPAQPLFDAHDQAP